MKNFKEKILMLLAEIDENKNLDRLLFEYKDPVPPEAIEEKQDEHSIQFSDDMKAFYGICGGLKLKWKSRIESKKNELPEIVEGSINILDPDTMIMGYDGRHWLNELWTDSMDTEMKTFKRRLKVFDYFGTDNVDAVAIEMKDNVLPSGFWLNSLDFGVFKMNVDLNGYLDLLLRSKGIWGWQYFYADIKWSGTELYQLKNNATLILEKFPELFKDNDIIEDFKQLYQAKTI